MHLSKKFDESKVMQKEETNIYSSFQGRGHFCCTYI